MKITILLVGAVAVGLFGCSSGDGDGDNGLTHTYVFSNVDWGVTSPSDGNVAPGFDLDDAVSERNDNSGCGVRDRVDPDGVEGIDNELGGLITLASNDVLVAPSEGVAAGELVLLIRVSEVDDLTADEDVTVELLTGALPAGATPAVDADGHLEAGQTFEADAASGSTATGAITAGALLASDLSITFVIPMADNPITIDLEGGRLSASIADGALTDGVLAGSVSIEAALTAGEALGFTAETIRPVLEAAADMGPDVAGDCQRLSVTFLLAGAEAVF